MSGFYLVRLSLKGEGVKTSSIRFEKGLNIVYGGSDIGKTFIYQCIDYLLGGAVKPKEIKQSRKYNEYELEIKDYDEKSYIIYKDEKKDYFLLNKKEKLYLDNKNKQTTISDFLLSLAKIEGKSIEIDKYGQTKKLFFQNLRNYFLLDEDNIIAKKSKIAGYEFKEQGVFRFLVTEEDDSTNIQIASDNEISNKKKIRKTLENKILAMEEEIQGLEGVGLVKIDFSILIKERLDDIEIKFIEEVKYKDNKALCPSCGTILVCNDCQKKKSAGKKILFRDKEQVQKEVNSKLKKVEEEYFRVIKDATKIEILKQEKDKYVEELKELIKEIKNDNEKLLNLKIKKVSSSKAKPITDIMLNILKEIKFDNIENVEFSPNDLDFLINNEKRGIYGQGYRAIVYATFLIAILEYLDDKPYSIGFTMIDSPFNPYKVKNEKDKNLAHNFYRYLDLSNIVNNRQAIIFENTKPPKEFNKRMRDEIKGGFLKGEENTLFSKV